jgi:hypothetical protein
VSTHKHYFNMADGESVANGEQGIDIWEVRQTLLSNSTKRRSAEVNSIRDKLVSGGRLSHTHTHTHLYFCLALSRHWLGKEHDSFNSDLPRRHSIIPDTRHSAISFRHISPLRRYQITAGSRELSVCHCLYSRSAEASSRTGKSNTRRIKQDGHCAGQCLCPGQMELTLGSTRRKR